MGKFFRKYGLFLYFNCFVFIFIRSQLSSIIKVDFLKILVIDVQKSQEKIDFYVKWFFSFVFLFLDLNVVRQWVIYFLQLVCSRYFGYKYSCRSRVGFCGYMCFFFIDFMFLDFMVVFFEELFTVIGWKYYGILRIVSLK